MPSIHDWQPFTYELPEVALDILIYDDHVIVESEIDVERKQATDTDPLFLDGTNLELLEISVDGTVLGNNQYKLEEGGLTIFNLPDECLLEIKQKLVIAEEAVDGLYYSGENLITQCEDEGFRKIAFFADRPDVLSTYTVCIEADKDKFPTLLSNGDELIFKGDPKDPRHTKTFHDPYPKPCYLFAMAAGKFSSLSSNYQTYSGKNVELTIYSDPKSIRQCSWAMRCLKAAFNYDELVFGLEYDLDRFSIVSVEKFVFGAMENKSLNVFNNSVLLASPDVSTDETYERIQSVVGHEYFHNYSGNRVTVRDWFQLSLKEGLTVLRDQSFSRFMSDFSNCRIMDADFLRREQFPEAQSGLSHPVQPQEMEVPANYYTRTIYEGGAEVVYMLSNLLGEEAWQAGLADYFEEFDGQAVTIQDFIEALATSSSRDLSRYERWYSTSGTPRVNITESRNEEGNVTLSIEQFVPPTADQLEKETLPIPLGIGLVSSEADLLSETNPTVVVESEGASFEKARPDGTIVFELEERHSEITFSTVPEEAEFSINRNFSAPVEVTYHRSDEEEARINRLVKLVEYDTNPYAKWDAMQQLFVGAVLNESSYESALTQVVDQVIGEIEELHPSYGDEIRRGSLWLTMPNEGRILDLHKRSRVEDILAGLDRVERMLGETYSDRFEALTTKFKVSDAYEPSAQQIAARSVSALCYRYLLAANRNKEDAPSYAEDFARLFRDADNLTDRLTYFKLLLKTDGEEEIKSDVTQEFYERFKDNALIVERWIAAQIRAQTPGAIDRIANIRAMGLLEKATPNRWRSAYSSFSENWLEFHKADGSGYTFYTDQLIADAEEHASVVRRGIQALTYWHRHDEGRSQMMRDCLERLGSELPSSQIPALDMVKRGLRASPTV